MKTILLSIALVSIAFASKAQFTVGQKMIGWQINTGYNEQTPAIFSSNKTFSAALNFSLSTFKTPTSYRSFGLSYAYYHNNNDAGSGNTNVNNAHSVGVFADHVKLERLANRFYFTMTGTTAAAVRFERSTNTSSGISTGTRNNIYDVSLVGSIGLLYQLNQRWLFTCNLLNVASIGFTHIDSKTFTGSATSFNGRSNTAYFSSGFNSISFNSLSIGAKYMIR